MIFRLCRSVDCTERGGKQVTGCIQSFMLPWKPRKRHIWPVSQNLSPVNFLPAKFQLVSCNLSVALIWQMTYTHKLPKLCSATFSTTTRPSHLIVLGLQTVKTNFFSLFWPVKNVDTWQRKNLFGQSTWSGHCPKFILSHVIILRQLCDTQL